MITKLGAKLQCSEINSISDFHKKFGKQIDTKRGGQGENTKINCGQINGSELKDKYYKYYSDYEEKDFAQAACEFCLQKKENATWKDFYTFLKDKGYVKNNVSD